MYICDNIRKALFLSFFLSFFLFCSTLAAKSDKLCCELKKIQACCSDVNAKQKCQYVIHAADITTQGFVIDKPGVWCLDGDINFNPPLLGLPTVQAAITIQAGLSDVTLILGDHTISQVGSGTSGQVPYVIGILVPDPLPTSTDPNAVGAQSIYIEGDQAIIDGFSMFGIRVFAHTYDIRISNVTVKNCGALASSALRPGAFPEYFPHSTIVGPNPFGVGGIVIGESASFGMGPQFFGTKTNPQNRTSEIVLDNVSCLNNFFNGLMIVFSTNISLNGCRIDDTWSDDPGSVPPVFPAHTALAPIGIKYGFNASDDITQPACFNIRMTDCTCNNTILRGDFTRSAIGVLFAAQGVSDQWTRGIFCENCQFNGTTSTFVGGIAVNYSSARTDDSTYINCSFDGGRGLTGVEGLHRSGFGVPNTKSASNNTFINCTANDNQQIGNLQLPVPVLAGAVANGFHLDFAKNVTFIDCTANDNIINGPADVTTLVPTASNSNAAGFAISDATSSPGVPDSFSENFSFQNCVAMRNQTVNGGVAQGFQFIYTSNTSSNLQIIRSYVLQNCVASGNNALVPGFGIPAWNAATSYVTGAVVFFNGQLFTATAANQNVQPPAAPWVAGPAQSVSQGFAVFQNPSLSAGSWPISFINCVALHNIGAERQTASFVSNPNPPANGFIFSAGFYLLNAERHSLTGCEAIDNMYGIFLQQNDRTTVRVCRSDNNSLAGFVDVGLTGTPASPTPSTSLFERNEAFANGTNVHTGATGNYDVVYPFGPVPILTGSLTTGYPLSGNFVPAQNISMIK